MNSSGCLLSHFRVLLSCFIYVFCSCLQYSCGNGFHNAASLLKMNTTGIKEWRGCIHRLVTVRVRCHHTDDLDQLVQFLAPRLILLVIDIAITLQLLTVVAKSTGPSVPSESVLTLFFDGATAHVNINAICMETRLSNCLHGC